MPAIARMARSYRLALWLQKEANPSVGSSLSFQGEGTDRCRRNPWRQLARMAPSPFRERAGERAGSGSIFQVGAAAYLKPRTGYFPSP